MAKKKIKNLKLEQTELQPITIGQFESRRKTSIGIFIILTIFIAAVFFLPEISNVITKYLNPTPVEPSKPSENPNTPIIPPDDDDTTSDEIFLIADDLKIEKEDITMSDIKINKETNTISFSITNNTNNPLILNNLNYYLELYFVEGNGNTLLERVKLGDTSTLVSGSFINFTKDISANTANSATSIMLVKKSIDDYPVIELEESEEGNSSLICTKGSHEVTYKFTKNALQEVVSKLDYKETTENYTTIYQDSKTNSTKYNSTPGIISTWIDYTGGFNVTTTINLAETSRTTIFDADTFERNTEPKVVKFEIEAQGFSCK